MKLLTRLYDPDEGRILLGRRDLRDYGLDELRGSMGVIFQDFVRYNLRPAGQYRSVSRRVRATIISASRAPPAAARPTR